MHVRVPLVGFPARSAFATTLADFPHALLPLNWLLCYQLRVSNQTPALCSQRLTRTSVRLNRIAPPHPTFRHASSAMATPSASAAQFSRVLRSSIPQTSRFPSRTTSSQILSRFASQSRTLASATHTSHFSQRNREIVTTPISPIIRRARELCTDPSKTAWRGFSATAVRPRDHHFDTLKFVQRLKDEGFTEEQAVAMMKVLGDVIEERYDRSTPIPPLPTTR